MNEARRGRIVRWIERGLVVLGASCLIWVGALAMQTVTDTLARLFGATSPWIRAARNFGMTVVDGLPPTRRFLAHSALR